MAKKTYKLLVVEDDELILQAIEMILPDQWEMTKCQRLEDLPDGFFHLALVDNHLSDDPKRMEGMEVLRTLNDRDPRTELVSISGNIDRAVMEQCLTNGATRFLAKPFAKDELLMVLDKVEALILLRDATQRSGAGNVQWIGESNESNASKRTIANLRGEDGPILVEGESGTGKEVTARFINSQEREDRPFITINVAAIPENLFESELFGHTKGAFTGADSNKMGLAEAAHGGDLFLDEIEALPLNQQAKLLRFLENGEIQRVGSKDTIHVKVRVIAATNRNLEEMVKNGEFREDLLWRLSGKKVTLPPLRDRKEDVILLAKHFLDSQKPRYNKTFDDEALQALSNYSWPGNVRELKRLIEQICLTAPLPIIRKEDVAPYLRSKSVDSNRAAESLDLGQGLSVIIQQYERSIIEKAIAETEDVEKAANLLKVSRSTFYKKLKDYNINS